MNGTIPGYVSIVFILTTFLSVGFFYYAVKISSFDSLPGKLAVSLVSFWVLFQAILGIGGFYSSGPAFPRFPLTAAVPALGFVVFLLLFQRRRFSDLLSLKVLTLIHVVRIPVEVVLWWLYQNGEIPRVMTFEGRNFDILVGITAPIIAWIAFRAGKPNRKVLLVWNFASLLLLTNIVAIAVMSIEGPLQRFGFEQPNRAVLFFPFVWLPSVVVPVVLFAHLNSILRLLKKDNQQNAWAV